MVQLRGCPLCSNKVPLGRTKVHYDRIVDAFTNKGMFAPDMYSIGREAVQEARKIAPKRTYRLANLHYYALPPNVGPQRWLYLGNKAGYAGFLLGGTAGNGSGYIYPKRGEELELRPIPYSRFPAGDSRRFQPFVRGQRQKENWLRIALNTAVEKRLLRGLRNLRMYGIRSTD